MKLTIIKWAATTIGVTAVILTLPMLPLIWLWATITKAINSK